VLALAIDDITHGFSYATGSSVINSLNATLTCSLVLLDGTSRVPVVLRKAAHISVEVGHISQHSRG
jgi:hypothetical protein